MDLVMIASSRPEASIAGNGSSAPSSSSSSSSGGDSSKPSNHDLNNQQPKPVSMRMRSSDRKRQRPHDQPPTDDNHSSDAARPPHRHDIYSATEGLLVGSATPSKPLVSSQFEPAALPPPPPPLKRLREATNFSSDGRRSSQHREAPIRSPALSTPVPAAAELPTQDSAAKYLPASGGSFGSGRARKSRLSLNRHRPLRPPLPPHSSSSNSSSNSSSGVVGTDGSNLGSPWRPSPQQRRQSPSLSSAAILPPHGEDRLAAGREDSVDNLAGDNLASTPPCSLPPPLLPPPLPLPPRPPFVGLENLGETCYVNAVVQALVACEAGMPDATTSSNGGGREDSTGRRERVDGSDSPSSALCIVGEGISVEAAAVGGRGTTGGIGRGDENSVLVALGNLLKEIKERNQALSALASSDAPPQLVAPGALVTAHSLLEDVATHSDILRPTGVEVGSETAAMSETRRLCESPPRALDHPRNVGLCAVAINPVELVNLIREGWLNAGRGTGGVKAGRERHRGRLADPTAPMGFGSGQQCASELLGKLLDLPAASVPSGCGGEAAACSVRGRDINDSTSGLIEAFRGELCTRTTCVECERDRATREEFTELTLPPLLPQHPPPSPNRAAETASAAAVASTANGHPLSEHTTLESLVDAVLGSETLDGNSKVWCEACSQRTEAKRRISINSPPRLLALHVRPAKGRQSMCPPPAIGRTVGMRGRGTCKARERDAIESKNGEGLIGRVLIVKGAARHGFHVTEGAGAAASSRNRLITTTCTSGGTQEEARGQEDRALKKLGESEDVRYELVGIILHKGQTLGSGHYTFALHTGASFRSVGQCSRQRSHRSSSALGVGAGDEGRGPLPREADARSSESASASAMESVHGSAGEGGAGKGVGVSAHGSSGQGGAGKAVGGSTNKEAFVLFDDACVRWLSPEEECEVLRGGGGGGGLRGRVFGVLCTTSLRRRVLLKRQNRLVVKL